MTTRDINQDKTTNFGFSQVADGPNLDAFGNMRVTNPTFVFDAQLNYDLARLLYEQITTGTGGAVAYDSTNGQATLSLTSSSANSSAYLQSFEYFRYQPGRSQKIFMSFNAGGNVSSAGVTKFIGYSDGVNGYEFQITPLGPQFALLSSTNQGNQIIPRSQWSLDRLDGTGSGIVLDLTKTQILVIDFQALYAGRIRFGFDINGQIFYCHEIDNANVAAYPYIRTANLPVRCGLSCATTATDSMSMICCSVTSEGGDSSDLGYEFSASGSVLAASGAQTHILSIQPLTTYQGLTNRSKIVFDDFELLNTGTVPVQWFLCLGCTLTGTNAFTAANSNYSAVGYNTAGTLSGSPAIVLASGFVSASGSGSKYSLDQTVAAKIREPISLDHSGNVRQLGTLSILVSGIGGTAQCYATINWHEVR